MAKAKVIWIDSAIQYLQAKFTLSSAIDMVISSVINMKNVKNNEFEEIITASRDSWGISLKSRGFDSVSSTVHL
uniref:PINc domain-containing protein n=1 Tax=Syphacia muris TaxID=451379 RepID=A0A0N5AXE5_9BILA